MFYILNRCRYHSVWTTMFRKFHKQWFLIEDKLRLPTSECTIQNVLTIYKLYHFEYEQIRTDLLKNKRGCDANYLILYHFEKWKQYCPILFFINTLFFVSKIQRTESILFKNLVKKTSMGFVAWYTLLQNKSPIFSHLCNLLYALELTLKHLNICQIRNVKTLLILVQLYG